MRVGVNNIMLIRIFLSVFLLFTTCHSSTNIKQSFIIKKEFSVIKKEIDNYLATKKYNAKQTDDKILEMYFDVPELNYLKQNGMIRYRAVEYRSKKKNKIKYRESIAYTLDGNTTSTFSVKHYNNIKSMQEKHPMLTLVKRKERQVFLNQLHQDGVKYPMRLKKIVQVSKVVHTLAVENNSNKIANISISQVEASALDQETNYVMLTLETDNTTNVSKEIKNLLGLQAIAKTEYQLAFDEMNNNVFLFYWILRYPYLINLLYGLGFGLIGFMLIFLLFRKRLMFND
ncbi:MAG: hypothetical protein GQ531_02030 [Sulfurovum sp.]|nr:hypothetical protein [Sulfurovum sp.]